MCVSRQRRSLAVAAIQHRFDLQVTKASSDFTSVMESLGSGPICHHCVTFVTSQSFAGQLRHIVTGCLELCNSNWWALGWEAEKH